VSLSTTRADPETLPNGSFEDFCTQIAEEGLHLGQCAVKWLEALLISPDATYTTVLWTKEFAKIVTSVGVLYENNVSDRVRRLLDDWTFSSTKPVELIDLQVPR
jgi:hypothetical protein